MEDNWQCRLSCNLCGFHDPRARPKIWQKIRQNLKFKLDPGTSTFWMYEYMSIPSPADVQKIRRFISDTLGAKKQGFQMLMRYSKLNRKDMLQWAEVNVNFRLEYEFDSRSLLLQKRSLLRLSCKLVTNFTGQFI